MTLGPHGFANGSSATRRALDVRPKLSVSASKVHVMTGEGMDRDDVVREDVTPGVDKPADAENARGVSGDSGEDPTDVPLGGLPPADRTLLRGAPLEVVVVEMRFTSAVKTIGSGDAFRIRDALAQASGTLYPRVERAVQQQMQIDFGNDSSAQFNTQSEGWQFISEDSRTQITLMPAHLIMQTSDYKQFSATIQTPLAVLLTEIADRFEPELVQRVGLRYINQFRDHECASAMHWTDRINESFLGPACHPVLGPYVQTSQQQVQLKVDPEHGALLRHGPIDDAANRTHLYLLDIDVFRHATHPFDIDDATRCFRALNRTALSLFQSAVNPDYLRLLQHRSPSQQDPDAPVSSQEAPA